MKRGRVRALVAFETDSGRWVKAGDEVELPLAEATRRRLRGQVKVLEAIDRDEGGETPAPRPPSAGSGSMMAVDRMMREPGSRR